MKEESREDEHGKKDGQNGKERKRGPRKRQPLEQRDYYYLDETAAEIGNGVSTLYQWQKLGKGPKSYKVGREYRFPKKNVDDWKKRGGSAGE